MWSTRHNRNAPHRILFAVPKTQNVFAASLHDVLCVSFCAAQMVWEQGSVVIVMLTKLTENGVAMCHRYWPEEGSDLYHIYEVLSRCLPE